MARTYQFISSDGHLEVRPEVWTKRVPKKYRDRAPRTVELPNGGQGYLIEGQPIREVHFLDNRAGRKEGEWRPFGLDLEDTAGTGSPEERLKALDVEGMDAEVFFPSQNAGPSLWRTISHDEVYCAVVRAYNDWQIQDYCAADPERLIGLAFIPMTNINDAMDELQRAAKLGYKGVQIREFPSGKGYPTPEDDRFYEAALDLGLSISVHISLMSPERGPGKRTFQYAKEDPETMRRIGHHFVDWVANFGLGASLPLSQLVLSGVFERFPKLEFFFAETRLGWIPFWLESADLWYERHLPWAVELLGFKPLERKPSEYVHDHIWWSIQYERVALELRHRFNVDHIMFASDFPHIECEWPNSMKKLQGIYHDLTPEERHKIWAGNAVRFFKLDEAPAAPAQARKVATA